jgi:hypothetical protein
LSDQHIFGDGVGVADLRDRITMVAVHAVVDDVECGEMLLGGCLSEVVVVPLTPLHERTRRPDRHTAEGCDALGDCVDHLTNGVDLRVEHLVDCDGPTTFQWMCSRVNARSSSPAIR